MHTLSKMPTPTCTTLPLISPATAPPGTVFVRLGRGYGRRAKICEAATLTRWTPKGSARLDNGDLCHPAAMWGATHCQILRYKSVDWRPWTAELQAELAAEANLRRTQRIFEGIISDALDVARGHKSATDAQLEAALPHALALAAALGITPLDIPEEVF